MRRRNWSIFGGVFVIYRFKKIRISDFEHKKSENCRTCSHPRLTASYQISRKKVMAIQSQKIWPKFDKKLKKFRLFWLYFSRSFQWFNPNFAIGNTFGVKPEKSIFSSFLKMHIFAPNFNPQKLFLVLVSDFLILVVSYSPCKQSKPKNASKI